MALGTRAGAQATNLKESAVLPQACTKWDLASIENFPDDMRVAKFVFATNVDGMFSLRTLLYIFAISFCSLQEALQCAYD